MWYTVKINKALNFEPIMFLPLFLLILYLGTKGFLLFQKASNMAEDVKVHRMLRTYHVNINSYCIKAFNLI